VVLRANLLGYLVLTENDLPLHAGQLAQVAMRRRRGSR
jgi:hypothetical protein